VGSSDARLATPLAVLERTRIEEDAARLMELVRDYEIDKLVVGLPRQNDDSVGEQENLTRAYAGMLQPLLGLEVVYHDERFSTFAALESQRARGLSAKRGRSTIDADAAAVILQDFFDRLEDRETGC
jgi:putative Holliday junction resolvase